MSQALSITLPDTAPTSKDDKPSPERSCIKPPEVKEKNAKPLAKLKPKRDPSKDKPMKPGEGL